MFFDPNQADIVIENHCIIYLYSIMKFSANKPIYTHYYSSSYYPFTKYIRINNGELIQKNF